MASKIEFIACCETIKNSGKKALETAVLGVSLEENKKFDEAAAVYQDCIAIIDHIFQIPVRLPDDIEEIEKDWDEACTMIKQLKRTKTEAQSRVETLKSLQVEEITEEADAALAALEPPAAKKSPMLLETPQIHYDKDNNARKKYAEIIHGLREILASKECDVTFDAIFEAPVKLYKIQMDGHVTTISGDTSISLTMCTVGQKWQYLNGSYFIKCSIPIAKAAIAQDDAATSSSSSAATIEPSDMVWLYPLIPSMTTCHRTDFGAFIFPDFESEDGSVFGILLANKKYNEHEVENIQDLQQFFQDLLEAILAQDVRELAYLGEEAAPPGALDTSQVISSNIVGAADFVSCNLVKAAEKTGELMFKSTPYIMSKMQPAAENTPPVSTKLQTTVNVAKGVSSTAASVTGWIANKVGVASMAVGGYLAPHIQTQGAKMLEKGFGYDTHTANTKMEGALTIAAGAVEGFSSLYNGLETSAKILGNSLSDNSVKLIEYKYGTSAGNVAAGSFETIGNAFNVSQNVNCITPKGMAKRFAKSTGRAVVDDYAKTLRVEQQHYVPAGVLVPDLKALKELTA